MNSGTSRSPARMFGKPMYGRYSMRFMSAQVTVDCR
jgi:hypothetical protein